jgi:HEAT repeat protein
VPALIEALKDRSAHVRKMAVLALGDMGLDTGGAVPALVDVLLHDQDPAVGRRAAIALGEIGVVDSVSALHQASKRDTDESVRRAAGSGLSALKEAV